MRATARQTCTDHCSFCGGHYHGQGAYDAHLQRFDEGPNAQGARSYRLQHADGSEVGLKAWTMDGVCELSRPAQEGVTIWQKPLSARDQQRLAQIATRG